MREIKFRAWDKGMMFPHNCIDYSNFGTHAFFYEKLMQYTGMKDKTGKDIYEGDILRFPAKDKWDETNFSAFEVFWHDNDCADRHVGFQMGRMHNFGNVAGGMLPNFLPGTTEKMIIIGNIFENPELIESD